jgi:hypothetical protein
MHRLADEHRNNNENSDQDDEALDDHPHISGHRREQIHDIP